MTTTHSPSPRVHTRGIAVGIGGGIAGAIAMGMWAMIASERSGKGFFTPMHHIAALLAGNDALMGSVKAAMHGNNYEISAGAAILGLVMHMMVGAILGALFGAALSYTPLARSVSVVAGLLWGAVIAVLNALVVLPIAAGIFGVEPLAMGPAAGKTPVADMASMAGWATWLPEHLVFGLVLGLVVAFGSVGTALRRA